MAWAARGGKRAWDAGRMAAKLLGDGCMDRTLVGRH